MKKKLPPEAAPISSRKLPVQRAKNEKGQKNWPFWNFSSRTHCKPVKQCLLIDFNACKKAEGYSQNTIIITTHLQTQLNAGQSTPDKGFIPLFKT